MSQLNNYKTTLASIRELVDKMEKGELSLDELEQLEKMTREIHERSIILRYKAFEAQVKEKETPEVEEKEETESMEETITESLNEVSESIDFSLFEEEVEEKETVPPFDFSSQEEPKVEESTEVEPKEEEVKEEEEPSIDFSSQEAPKVDEVKEESPVIDPKPVQEEPVNKGGFVARLKIENHSYGSNFKIDSLIGAFGLNERLRFINELFDGSSELFSDAIKALDSQPSINEAHDKIEDLAVKHEWNAEEDAVIEFMTMINRRYA